METKKGKVISTKQAKTAIVLVESIKENPLYHKKFKISQKIKVHDSKDKAKVGDKVIITPCRPMSKEKRWKVIEILNSKSKNSK